MGVVGESPEQEEQHEPREEFEREEDADTGERLAVVAALVITDWR